MTEHRELGCWAPRALAEHPALSAAAQTRFVEEPEDQTVVAGQRIVLSCVVLNYSGIVQWTKDGLALGMGQGLKGTRGAAVAPGTSPGGAGVLGCYGSHSTASPRPIPGSLCSVLSWCHGRGRWDGDLGSASS